MDGYQATAEIRRREAAESVERGVPIVALTAHAAEGEREKCLEAGMDDYLSKPFRQDALREVLERWSGAPAVGPPARPDAGAAAVSGTSRGAGEDGPIDFAALDAIRALESAQQPVLLADLIRNHRERAAELIEDLLWALEDADVEGVREAARSLETGSGNVGALGVAALCREVEWLVRNGELARAKAAFVRLADESAHPGDTGGGGRLTGVASQRLSPRGRAASSSSGVTAAGCRAARRRASCCPSRAGRPGSCAA
jgi:HPt (histidine-containing phosphotransfer) domain-containing protein